MQINIAKKMRLKIAVVVPLLAPELAKDWKHVQFCLNRTLTSILNSSSVDLQIYVICQSEPEAMISDRRIIFLKSEHSIPEGAVAMGFDKGLKTAQGVQAAAQFEPDYVMQIDADDMISKNLFDCIIDQPGYDAYCVNCGYEWIEDSKKLTRRYQFHRFCGTSFILRYGEDLFPAWLGNKGNAKLICETSHTNRAEVLLAHQYNIYYINEPKVIYVSGGQDQLMDRTKRLRRRVKDTVYGFWRDKKLSHDLRDEFSM